MGVLTYPPEKELEVSANEIFDKFEKEYERSLNLQNELDLLKSKQVQFYDDLKNKDLEIKKLLLLQLYLTLVYL